jgi:hypothetical protein
VKTERSELIDALKSKQDINNAKKLALGGKDRSKERRKREERVG